jgi:7-cyano-7-deazaguanine synthase
MKKAIVLFSGGLDSTTCLAIAKNQGFDCYALSVDYGQKHVVELNAAKRLAEIFAAKHIVLQVPIGQLKGSALTDETIAVPDYQGVSEIPVTYVPARNTIFLSVALGLAESLQAQDIFIGVSAVDYSGYPDCRPEYIAAFQTLANLATKKGVEEGNIKIHSPLIHLSKAETIQLGLSLGVNYANTISCYKPNSSGHACGKCDSCYLRKKGFIDAGVSDPTMYYHKFYE